MGECFQRWLAQTIRPFLRSVAIGGDLQIEENARVTGDAFAIGGQVVRAESAVVSGSEFTLLEQFSGVFDRFGVLGTFYLIGLIFWMASFVAALIAGLLLLMLLPGHITAISAAIRLRPLTSLVYGIGGLAALSILTVLTAGNILGAVLILLANLAFLVTVLFGGNVSKASEATL